MALEFDRLCRVDELKDSEEAAETTTGSGTGEALDYRRLLCRVE
jgi:hypothetical protein